MILLLVHSTFACTSSKTLPAKAVKGVQPQSTAEVELPRPRKAAGSLLRTWLATQENRFTIQRMDDCQAQIVALSTSAKSRDELRKLSKQLRADIASNLELHHWCFYHLLMRLEMKLEQDSLGTGYQERLQNFTQENKALWILAMALDQVSDDTYYRYIARKRYIALSQMHFGRNLLPAKGTLNPEDDPEAVDPDELEDEDDDDVGGGEENGASADPDLQ